MRKMAAGACGLNDSSGFNAWWTGRGSGWRGLILCIVALCGGFGWIADARASVKCEIESGSASITLPALTISATAAVGTVFWSKSDITLSAQCSLNRPGVPAALAYFNRRNLDLGNGLSFMLTYDGHDEGNTDTRYSTGTMVTSFHVPGVSSTRTPVSVKFSLALVKTGDRVTGDALSRYRTGIVLASIGGGPDMASARSEALEFRLVGTTNVTVATSTCSVREDSKNIVVPLGQTALQARQGFGSGVGSTARPQNFAISLTCEAATPNSPSGIYVQLDGSMMGAAFPGVLALSGQSSASGVGIQVSTGDGSGAGSPVTFGTPWKTASFSAASKQLTIPLSARYYQTGAQVTPGQADSTATFTVSYQ